MIFLNTFLSSELSVLHHFMSVSSVTNFISYWYHIIILFSVFQLTTSVKAESCSNNIKLYSLPHRASFMPTSMSGICGVIIPGVSYTYTFGTSEICNININHIIAQNNWHETKLEVRTVINNLYVNLIIFQTTILFFKIQPLLGSKTDNRLVNCSSPLIMLHVIQ